MQLKVLGVYAMGVELERLRGRWQAGVLFVVKQSKKAREKRGKRKSRGEGMGVGFFLVGPNFKDARLKK